ncbi:MAG TPA: hypothetical protein VI542_12375 [Candidatus Tectomicrobia bacterium]
MAAESQHERQAHAEQARQAEHEQARPAHRPTHDLTMTTREKRLLMTPYDAIFEVESGACTLDVVDTMHTWVVAGDRPGDARVSVTPQEPHADYVPAQVHCHIVAPVTELLIGDAEPK